MVSRNLKIDKSKIYIIASIVLIILISLYLQRRKEGLAAADGNAAEACKQISSKADEIEAGMKGASDIVGNIMAFANPKNYRSGDNKTDNMVRNIINQDMSNDDVTKISNDCVNTSVGVQSNIIDTSDCPYCQQYGCPVTNVSQSNADTATQTCTMQSVIETLMKKKNSVDAQALAQVAQKAQGLLSGGNTQKSQNCNIVNTDMSSSQYFEAISTCANNNSMDQQNKIAACGSVSNVIQQNTSDKIQTCIQGATIKTDSSVENDTKIKSTIAATQATEGVTLGSILASVGGSLCSCCIVGVIIYVIYKAKKKNNGSG